VASLILMRVVPSRFEAGDPRADSWILLITVAVSTVVWIAVTFATRPEPEAVLDRFYQRVRPGGRGWAQVSQRLGHGREPMAGGALNWTNWVAGVVAVYSSLFGIGRIVFGEYLTGAATLALAALSFAWIARSFRGDRFAAAGVAEPRREAAPAAD